MHLVPPRVSGNGEIYKSSILKRAEDVNSPAMQDNPTVNTWAPRVAT